MYKWNWNDKNIKYQTRNTDRWKKPRNKKGRISEFVVPSCFLAFFSNSYFLFKKKIPS